MLTEEEKKEILKEVEHYPYPAAACIDALKIVQEHRGWVSDESVSDISRTVWRLFTAVSIADRWEGM